MGSLTWIDGYGWGVGQLCALGIHSLAWWLRRKALWELSLVGLLGAVGLWLVVGLLLGVGYWGDVPLTVT